MLFPHPGIPSGVRGTVEAPVEAPLQKFWALGQVLGQTPLGPFWLWGKSRVVGSGCMGTQDSYNVRTDWPSEALMLQMGTLRQPRDGRADEGLLLSCPSFVPLLRAGSSCFGMFSLEYRVLPSHPGLSSNPNSFQLCDWQKTPNFSGSQCLRCHYGDGNKSIVLASGIAITPSITTHNPPVQTE